MLCPGATVAALEGDPNQDKKRKSRVIRRDSQGECPESSSDSKREEKPLAIFFKAIALLYYYRTLK